MDVVLWVLGILLIVIGLGVSIALHEIGHLVPAKAFGVKCPQYMIGFGPTLWSRRRGETEYGVKAVPLGGYVRMIGMIPPRPGDRPGQLRDSSTGRFGALVEQARQESVVEVQPGDEDRVFYKLSVPKKVVVMLGGPAMNLVLAFVLLVVLLSGIGVESFVPRVARIAECVPSAAPTAAKPLADCTAGDPTPPAAAALRVGDTVVVVNDKPVTRWSEVTEAIRGSAGQSLRLIVERDGARVPVTVPVVPVRRAAYNAEGTKLQVGPDGGVVAVTVGFLGVSPAVDFVRTPVTEVPAQFGETLKATAKVLVTVPQKLVGVVQAVTGGAERDPNGPISVVGVARAGGEIVAADLGTENQVRTKAGFIVGLLFGLNLALFLFNLLPLLPLDGGQVVGALWEGIKRRGAKLLGRPDPGYVDVAKGLPIAYAVSMVFIAMTLLLVYADLVSPVKLS